MGCSSSQIQTHSLYIHRKPQVCFILGGPGSNKGKIIEFLVRDYKFMYLSLFEILQFEKQRQTNEAQLIKQAIMNKTDFSPQLITQLLKKAIASLGPRRYLIDGYPRHKEDAQYFEKQPFTKQITLHQLIQIQVSLQRMKLTGMQAKKDDKRHQEQVQKQVNSVIEEYKKQEQHLIQFYKSKNALISVPQRDTQDESYNQLRLQLQNLPHFRNIHEGDARVFFASFDLEPDQVKYTYEQLTKSYGLCHLNYRQLIDECRQKSNADSKYLQECEHKKQQPSSEFTIYLFRKHIQKKDYIGNFLVTGFPRNINDALLWDKTFGWEVSVESYVHFSVSDAKLKQLLEKSLSDKAESQLDQCSRDKKVFLDFYEKQSKLTKINTQNPSQTINLIENLMTQKGIPKRTSTSPQKLIFLSTINEQFSLQLQKQSVNKPLTKQEQKSRSTDHVKEINMLYCYQNQTKENGLYSELIRSYIVTGAPLPGYLAVKILVKNLQHLISFESPKHNRQLTIIVKGFPNSAQQMVTWNQQFGQTYTLQSVIYFETSEDKIKQLLTKLKVQFTQETIDKIKRNSRQLEEYLGPHQFHAHKMPDHKKAQQFILNMI